VLLAFVSIWTLVAWPTIAVGVTGKVQRAADSSCCGGAEGEAAAAVAAASAAPANAAPEPACCCCPAPTPSDDAPQPDAPCGDPARCPCSSPAFGPGVVMVATASVLRLLAMPRPTPATVSVSGHWREISPLLRPPIRSA